MKRIKSQKPNVKIYEWDLSTMRKSNCEMTFTTPSKSLRPSVSAQRVQRVQRKVQLLVDFFNNISGRQSSYSELSELEIQQEIDARMEQTKATESVASKIFREGLTELQAKCNQLRRGPLWQVRMGVEETLRVQVAGLTAMLAGLQREWDELKSQNILLQQKLLQNSSVGKVNLLDEVQTLQAVVEGLGRRLYQQQIIGAMRMVNLHRQKACISSASSTPTF